MSDHDPFTLDMFGSSHSGLSSGLGFGVTAFSESPAIEPDKDVPLPAAPAKRSKSRQPAKRQLAEAPDRGSNFHLSGSRSLAKGWKARARDNLEAIALAAAIAACVLLIIEQLTVRRWGTSRMALTFFTINGIVSCVLGLAGIIDLALGA